MTMTDVELGGRLRAAREAAGLTQAEVAEHLALSRPTISQIESGNRTVTALELDRLAALFGREIRDLLGKEIAPGTGLAALFRSAPDLVREEDLAQALRDGIRLSKELARLEEMLDIPPRTPAMPVAGRTALPRTKWEAIRQGENAAMAERRRLDLGRAAINDVADLLERQGIRTAWVAMPDDISGVTIEETPGSWFVISNSNHPRERRRFSFAHEYGHVVLDRDRFGTVSRTSERDDLREVRANAFAACFLMPPDGVQFFVESLGKGQESRPRAHLFDGAADALGVESRRPPGSQDLQIYDVVLVAHHFGVSHLAALYRLRNLKVIGEPALERLLEEERAGRSKAWERYFDLPSRKRDKDEAREEFRLRFFGLALEAYRRELISQGKLLELARLVHFDRDTVLGALDSAGLLGPEGADPAFLLPEEE